MNRVSPPDSVGSFVQATVMEFQAPLTRYAARLMGDGDRARDVVQDTFVKLMAQQPAALNGHVAEWLYTVCRNRALDLLRKDGRMRRFEDGQMERVSADEPRPSRHIETAETHDELLRLIDRLPANQQEVIRLKFQNGFSYKEISRITTLSVSHVGVLIHHAVARLKAEFAASQRHDRKEITP